MTLRVVVATTCGASGAVTAIVTAPAEMGRRVVGRSSVRRDLSLTGGDFMSSKLLKEQEAMALKLGLSPSEAAGMAAILDEFIRVERGEGPIAFYKKQREFFGADVPQRRNEVTGCCPNCGNALTIKIERA